MNIQSRPSLTPAQQKRKQSLEDFRCGRYREDRVGRMPVGIRYTYDGSPYLWHFERHEKIDPTLTTRAESVVSTESDSSIADRELAHYNLQETSLLVRSSLVPQVSPLSQSPMVSDLFPSPVKTSLPISDSDAVSSSLHTESSAPAATGDIVGQLSSLAGLIASAPLTKQSDVIETVPAAAHELVVEESTKEETMTQPVVSKRLDDATKLFLDRMQMVIERWQMPIPGENREQYDEREHHVTVLTHCWVNWEELSQEERDHATYRVNQWATYFGIC